MRDAKYRHKWSEKLRKWIDDFVDIGEVSIRKLADGIKGDFIGYAHKQDEEGNFQFDPKMDRRSPIGRSDFQG